MIPAFQASTQTALIRADNKPPLEVVVANLDRDKETAGIVFRSVYGTYGELEDIRNAGGASLLTTETAEGRTVAEVADALGLEYLYNGQFGVSTGGATYII